ncbi:hypothetical protein PFFCH_01371 [Plasmodium falciparum FCH/4]|uniref:U1 small nuclear ribonucleoprotein C n=1 Tax=Plasmodium falciparum FCH/4 TaxID=1036724 RepID=A0A024VTI0_PLAFA|nr:hypothetical protein PFFCH_01371 [Plasmodium falciparum FCH/4]
MPKYYCEYCDIYLTHSSPVGRRQHIHGRKHISAKIEYFQNLLREEGITPQNFLGFLNNRNINNPLGNPMMNYMNQNMYMKYNPMKSYHSYSMRSSHPYRLNIHNNKYSRAGYVPPSHHKYSVNPMHNNYHQAHNNYSYPNSINPSNQINYSNNYGSNNFNNSNEFNKNMNEKDNINNNDIHDNKVKTDENDPINNDNLNNTRNFSYEENHYSTDHKKPSFLNPENSKEHIESDIS